MKTQYEVSDRNFLVLSYVSIVLFSIFPLFFSVPFRIHLDLPFEGAYRLYLGQAPFKDFGMPFGYGYFIFPTLFFYILGPSLSSLLYAQAFLNILSGVALVSVFRSLKLPKSVLFVGVFVYCLSYIFIYFWPWHTHTAFTFGLIAIALILRHKEEESLQKRIFYMSCAGLFSFLSFFTKQDYGGLNLLFCGALLLVQAYYSKRFWSIVTFALAYLGTALVCIGPWLKYGFGYWFNYGQPPHTARLELVDFLNEIFMSSDWEKFYLLAIVMILLIQIADYKAILADKTRVLAFLVCIGMIVEALLTKVTSRNSTGTTTFYHAFGVVFILAQLHEKVRLARIIHLIPILVFTVIWWSPIYYKYAIRMFPMKESTIPREKKETKVQVGWELSEFKTLKKVKIPVETIEGIRRLKQMPHFHKKAQVMNMTELTSLPEELGYEPLTGIPLWYDLGVAIFPKQVTEICESIKNKKYDVFLFEKVPGLENFYPEDVRTCLQKEYKLVDTFLAPRKEEDSTIEVYVRP